MRFTWICIFCFVSAVRPDVQLIVTTSPQTTSCGENVTLTCDVTSAGPVDIKLLTWVNTSCEYEKPEFGCESTKNDTNHRLTLRLFNVTPIDAGDYTCKLRSKMGHESKSTRVTVGECSGRPAFSVNQSHAWCSFNGFYPGGSVHWFQGADNLTGSTTTEEDVDQHGLYSMQSVMDIEKVKLPLNCSLWIPSLGKYASEQQVVGSGAGLVRLQRFCLLAGFILATSGL